MNRSSCHWSPQTMLLKTVPLKLCVLFSAIALCGLPGNRPASAMEVTDQKPAASDSLDDELLKGLGAADEVDVGDPAEPGGTDVVPADTDDPLIRLSNKMRGVESRIAEKKSDQETQAIQEGIVSELDKLIEAAQKHCKKCAGACSGKPGSESKPGKPGQSGGTPGAQPAVDSSKQLKNRTVRRPDMGEMQDLLKEVWGQLPEQMQKQMVQGPAEVFLPKYELMIEEYFRTLAEPKTGTPRTATPE